jgi:uracil-DNA glycosylase family 4
LSLRELSRHIIACERCPRLRAYCQEIARQKRRAYRDWDYWAKPVSGFGDPQAQLLIIGLAPGAHGSNRTGRMFTGDSSGDFLYRALHKVGFANRPQARARGDGLRLKNAYITAVVHCAPPQNKPTRQEVSNCSEYLAAELRLLTRVKIVLALGKIAFDSYLALLKRTGLINSRAGLIFGHGVRYELSAELPKLYAAYHPSRQNTQTGRLTDAMFDQVLHAISSEMTKKEA